MDTGDDSGLARIAGYRSTVQRTRTEIRKGIHILTTQQQQEVDDVAETLRDVEMDVLTESYTLADAIREGCLNTEQAFNVWRDGNGRVCTLTAAYLAAKARGIVQ